jgi:hypothetical protein
LPPMSEPLVLVAMGYCAPNGGLGKVIEANLARPRGGALSCS